MIHLDIVALILTMAEPMPTMAELTPTMAESMPNMAEPLPTMAELIPTMREPIPNRSIFKNFGANTSSLVKYIIIMVY